MNPLIVCGLLFGILIGVSYFGYKHVKNIYTKMGQLVSDYSLLAQKVASITSLIQKQSTPSESSFTTRTKMVDNQSDSSDAAEQPQQVKDNESENLKID